MKILSKYKLNFLAWAILVGLIFNLWLWLYTSWQISTATDLVPLHYTIYFGPDLLDYKSKLFTYPLIGLAILVVNTVSTMALSTGKNTRGKLLDGLIKMYKDNQVDGYYDQTLLTNYNKRYLSFNAVIACIGLTAIVAPLAIRFI